MHPLFFAGLSTAVLGLLGVCNAAEQWKVDSIASKERLTTETNAFGSLKRFNKCLVAALRMSFGALHEVQIILANAFPVYALGGSRAVT